MEHRLDPLGDLEVKRVLAFARAREQYPSVPRGLLLDYCQAAWQAAVAGDEDNDVMGRFERALVLVAWTHRRSPHLRFRDLVDQVIPKVALRPFMSERDRAPGEEPEAAPVVEAEPSPQPDAPRPPARGLIPSVPFASPIPLGAAVAAGFVGVTVLGQSGALPVAPFSPAGNEEASSGGDPHHGGGASATAGPVSHGAPGGGSEAATGSRTGLAAAPQAANAFRAHAATKAGAAAVHAPAAPARRLAAPVASPARAAPPQLAPAAPLGRVQAVGQMEEKAPAAGAAPELAHAPEELPVHWKHAPDVQVPTEDPVGAPADPNSGGPAPSLGSDKGNGSGQGDEGRRGRSHFQPIAVGQKPAPAKPPLDVPAPVRVGPPPASQQGAQS